MRKAIIAAGLATALAATSFAGSASAGSFHPNYWHGRSHSAWNAGPYYWPYHRKHAYYGPYRYQRPYYGYGYYGYNYDPGPAIVAGAIFGMIGTALAHQHHHYRYYRRH